MAKIRLSDEIISLRKRLKYLPEQKRLDTLALLFEEPVLCDDLVDLSVARGDICDEDDRITLEELLRRIEIEESKSNPNIVKRKVVHGNRWFDHYVDEVILPGGRHIPEHHVIHFHHESVGIVVTNEQDQILMVKVWRHPLNRYEWEISAGGLDEGEGPIEAAQRELSEETGFTSTDYKLLYSFNPLNGVTDKVFHIVKCIAESTTGSNDSEVAENRWFEKTELSGMIERNEIKDGLTLTGLLLVGIGNKFIGGTFA